MVTSGPSAQEAVAEAHRGAARTAEAAEAAAAAAADVAAEAAEAAAAARLEGDGAMREHVLDRVLEGVHG